MLRHAACVHLILLDLYMPHMDGWEFRAEQLRHEAWAHIPVIVISAVADVAAAAAQLNVRDILRKPVRLGDLRERIDRYVSTPPPV